MTRPRGRSHAPSDLLIQTRLDLHLLESTEQDGDGIFNADGTVNMVLIRPCNGRGPGRRIYEASMLERDAGVFAGLPMYDNHDSPQAKRARGHLPRPLADVRGAIAESYWLPGFTADDDAEHGFDPGAVVGRCRLTEVARSLIETVPEVVRTSLNMMATDLKPGTRNGRAGMLVEGITTYDDDSSSVDLVTVAGAGGRVAALFESIVSDHADDPPEPRRTPAPADDPDDFTLEEALDAASDDEIADYLRENRPHLIENAEEGDMGRTLQEALESREVQDHLARQIQEGIAAALTGDAGRALQEAAVARIAGPARLRVLRDRAKTLIEAARLPSRTATENLIADYGLAEHADGTATPARSLALIEARMDGDKVVRTDDEVLLEAIDADIRARRAELAEARPSTPWMPLTGDDKGELSEGAAAANVAVASRSLSSFGLDPNKYGFGTAVAAKEA